MKKTTPLSALALALVTAVTAAAPAPGAAPSSPGGGDGLDRFREQTVTWTGCRDASLDASGTECARITVPLDYREPAGRTIEIAVSRIGSPDPRKRRGILQTNPGGPGGPGLDMPAELRKVMSPEVAAAYDIIGMDTRGLGESTPIDCGLDRGIWLHAPGPDRAGFEKTAALAREDARRCWARESGTLPHLSTRNIARDADIVRAALGERKTSWFGHSYGSVLGAVHAQLFPHRVDRLVLDSAPDPVGYGMEMIRSMGPANERALDDFAAWAARRDGAYGLGATAAAVRAGVDELIRDARRKPIAIGGVELTHHDLPLTLFAQLSNELENPGLAETLRALRDTADGKQVAVPPVLQGFLDLMFNTTGSAQAQSYAAQLGVICADAAMPRDPGHYWRAVERSRASQPVFGPATHAPLPCAFWKERPREPKTKIGNKVPALQIQATGDTRTTYASGLGMHRAMRGSRLVTLPARAHAVYVYHPSTCVRETVDSYLLTGTLPARDTVCAK
ncbi:alpha/beta hydrolase [Streptomyces sp. CAU 1734]|uniref:alpha/beta hydrolase n=1 Tax=Streptomyces sp. CAU 1734 TaxID=3140360 RepID=UPI003261B588